MWYSGVEGATLQMHGVCRDRSSMSARSKSMPPSMAAASRCRIVLVEPPIAMSIRIALENASRVAMLRGSTDSSSSP